MEGKAHSQCWGSIRSALSSPRSPSVALPLASWLLLHPPTSLHPGSEVLCPQVIWSLLVTLPSQSSFPCHRKGLHPPLPEMSQSRVSTPLCWTLFPKLACRLLFSQCPNDPNCVLLCEPFPDTGSAGTKYFPNWPHSTPQRPLGALPTRSCAFFAQDGAWACSRK